MLDKIRRSDWMNTDWADNVLNIDAVFVPLFIGGSGPLGVGLMVAGQFFWGPLVIVLCLLYIFFVFCNTTSVTNRLKGYEHIDPYYENEEYIGRGETCKFLLIEYYNFNAEQRALLGGSAFVDSMLTKMSDEKRAKVNYLATKAVKEIKKEAKLRKKAELNSVPTDHIEDALTRAYDHAKIGNDIIREML